jgi:uracil-DNA glycosylase
MRGEAEFDACLREIRGCTVCARELPLGPRPVVRGTVSSRLLITSQAPGTRVHETGLSFNDRSGDVLRFWLGIDREIFYDESRVAIMPMGFCYPGRAANGGDLPPRRECAPLWHARLLPLFPAIRLNLLVGSYAIDYYLRERRKRTMTETVRAWREYGPRYIPLPHPSWRNVLWMRQNPWYEAEVLPDLRARVRAALES